MRDVYNKRQRIWRVELSGKIPISALFTALFERKGYENEFFMLYEVENGIKGDFFYLSLYHSRQAYRSFDRKF